MSQPRSIFIVAGESSGDLLGAQLMRAMSQISKVPIRFSGVGGHQMKEAGLYPVFPMRDIALMGAAEIVPRLRNIFQRMSATAKIAAKLAPDLVILIDSPEFNLRLAKRIKRRNPSIPVTLYVAPQVWASRPGRVRKMAKFVDHIFALFPFEKAFFEKAGIPCTIVGHPVVERKSMMVGGTMFRQAHDIPSTSNLICLLPGSRLNEVRRLLPIFESATELLLEEFPDSRLAIPVVPHVREHILPRLKEWAPAPIIVEEEAEKYALFDAADVALAASGTVALELALARTPAVIAYRVDPVTAFVARRIITTRFVNLINLIVDHPAIPELLQENCTADKLAHAVGELLRSEVAPKEQLSYVDKAVSALGTDDLAPSIRAARAVLALLEKKGAKANP